MGGGSSMFEQKFCRACIDFEFVELLFWVVEGGGNEFLCLKCLEGVTLGTECVG